MDKIIKKAFVVIGKEGSTLDGEGFIQKLWDDANGHFDEVAHLAKRDENGNLVGIWGASAEAPDGWTKWMIPGYEYLVVENHDGAFRDTIRQMQEEGIALVGAVHDYTDPATGKGYLYFPIKEVK